MYNFQLDYLTMSFESEGIKLIENIKEVVANYDTYIKLNFNRKDNKNYIVNSHNNKRNVTYNALLTLNDSLYDKAEKYASLISEDITIKDDRYESENQNIGFDSVNIIQEEISRIQGIFTTAFDLFCSEKNYRFMFEKVKAILGYRIAYKIILIEQNGRPHHVGHFCFINGSKAESCSLILTGVMFSLLEHLDYSALIYLYQTLNGSIKRIDIALDDYLNKFSFNKFLKSYAAGDFNYHKNKPLASSTVGDWLVPNSPKGRTFYMGSRTSEKFFRMYEKGKEKGDSSSKWIRYELELKPKSLILDCNIFANYKDVFLNSFKNFDTFFSAIKTSNDYVPFLRKKANDEISNDIIAKCNYLIKTYGSTLAALQNKNLLTHLLKGVNCSDFSKDEPFYLKLDYVFDSVSKCIDSERLLVRKKQKSIDKLKSRNLKKCTSNKIKM